MIFPPASVPAPETASISIVISSLSLKFEVVIDGGVVAPTDVVSPKSIVILFNKIVDPEAFISKVVVPDVPPAVVSEARHSVKVIAKGIRKVTFAVPVVSAVVSSLIGITSSLFKAKELSASTSVLTAFCDGTKESELSVKFSFNRSRLIFEDANSSRIVFILTAVISPLLFVVILSVISVKICASVMVLIKIEIKVCSEVAKCQGEIFFVRVIDVKITLFEIISYLIVWRVFVI